MIDEAALVARAADVLVRWGGASARPRLVKWRENVVFDVTLSGGRRVALRIHRPGYQTRRAVEAELDWTARLAASDVPVPAPVATRDGALTAMSGDAVVSAVAWLPGAPIGAAERPLAATDAERAHIMADVGRLIARVHDATDGLSLPPGFDRPRWDAGGLLGEAPLWGRFWENAAFTEADRALIGKARVAARDRLAGMADADFGLIHADCLRENILSDEGRLALIDFDDSGWGYRAYDLATALFQGLEEPGLGASAAALVRGYAESRPFPGDFGTVLTLFLMLRSFASAGWIMTRAAPGDVRLPFYAARAVRLARAVLDGRTAWT